MFFSQNIRLTRACCLTQCRVVLDQAMVTIHTARGTDATRAVCGIQNYALVVRWAFEVLALYEVAEKHKTEKNT